GCPAWRRIKHFCSMRPARRSEQLLFGFLCDLLAQRRLDRGFEFVRFYSMLQRASVFSLVKQRFRQMPVRRAELRGKLNRFGVVFDCLSPSSLLLKSETALEKDLCLKLLIIRRAEELAAFRHRKAQLLERLRQQFLSAISLAELETTFRTVGSGSHCLLVKTDGSFQIVFLRIDGSKGQVKIGDGLIRFRRRFQFADRLVLPFEFQIGQTQIITRGKK